MIRPSLPPRERSRVRHAAFTLIELLTVIAIILVLAGLLLHIAGGANDKASKARAQTEISAMSNALESYKADNGSYPRNTDTDTLNSQPPAGSAPPAASTYVAAGKYLYQALSGYGTAASGALNKSYMPFKSSQLSTGAAAPDLNTYVIDPFGIAYGYSTAGLAEQGRASSTNPASTPDPAKGYNPTFDLWSTGGWGTGGKNYANSGLPNTSYTNLWVKNW